MTKKEVKETTIDVEMEDKKKGKGGKSKKKQPKEEVPKVPLKQLFRYADTLDVVLMIWGTVGGLAVGATLPAFSFIFGLLIDVFNKPNVDVEAEVLKISLYFLYAGLGSLVVIYMQTGFWNLSATRQITRIRQQYLQAILRQEVGWFDKTPSGELTTRIASDTVVIQEAIGDKISTYIQFMATAIFGFALGFVKSWKLSLVMLAVTPLLAIAGAFMMKLMSSLTLRGQQAYAKAGAFATEVISGIRTIASFASEPKATQMYGVQLEGARKLGVRVGTVSGLGMGVTMFILFGTYGLALWYGSTLIIDGEVTGGDVLSCFFSLLFGAFALGQASPSIEAVAKGQGAAAKIYETIDRKPDIDVSSPSGKILREMKGDVELKDLYFCYPTRPEVAVFKGFNLSIKAGQTVALVGHSGSGKSTTVSLIQRFYDPDDGQVLIDGKNIKKLNLRWLRQQIGLVGQEPVLFSGTIAENIAYGKQGATMEEIEAAAKASNAHNFIMEFPEKYDTQVGEKGTQLSGGQKQRIAIARAIIKNPKVLLLDEATSALDAESEKIVQDALNSVMKGRTTIIVAHRLSTVRDADVIAVVHEGKIAELGTHDSLMAKEGLYFDLVKNQSKGDEKKKKLDVKQSIDKAKMLNSSINIEKKDTTIEAAADIKEEELKEIPFSRLIGLNRPEIPIIIIGCIAYAVNGCINPVFSILFSEMVNLFYQPPEEIRAEVWKWSLGFLAIGAGPLFSMTIGNTLFSLAGQKLIQRLRMLTFKAILRQNIGWFDKKENATGALAARLASEATLVESIVGTRIGLGVQNMSSLIAGLTIAFIYGWKLTLVVLATSPLIAFANFMHMYAMKGFTEKYRKANEEANAIATEAFANIRTIASFTYENRVFESYAGKLKKPTELGIRSSHSRGFLMGLGQLFLFGSYTLSFWYGGKLIADGEMNFLEVMRVFFAVVMVAMSVGQTASLTPDATKAKRAASVLFAIIDRTSEIDSASESGDKPEEVKGYIEMKGISFAYPTRPDAPVLRKLELSVKPGNVVALVGHSGCGKSSTVSLLERFYDPQDGSILLDGHDIRGLNIRWLRKQIGLVGQEPVLFSGTIAENILYGKEDATMEEIQEAAKAANAHNFIMEFPDKYDTQVGEKGTQLSGGQKQRIAIARAIIKNPKILLLDEATSALDAESEKIVQETLNSVMKGRTTVVIAHRLSTIRNADLIAVLNKGKVVEQGTHDDLMAKQGNYYNLVIRQTA